MFQDIYYVPQRTGTYSDVLVTYGLAALIDRIFHYAKGPTGHWRVDIEDSGSHYKIRLSEPLRPDWLDAMPYFRCLAPYVTGQYTSAGEASGDFDTLDVDNAWQEVKTYSELRSSLWDDGLRGTELAQQLDDKKPSRNTATVMFVGDYNMKAVYPLRKPGTIGTYIIDPIN